MITTGGCLTIDDESPRGARATAIAHTPHLAAQVADKSVRGGATPGARGGEAALYPPFGAASPFFEPRQ